MQKIILDIAGIAYSQTQSGSYVLTLEERDGLRKLPIVIGGFEAQAIAVELENMVPSRPLTHDLFRAFCQAFNVDIIEILIYKFKDGVFFAKLICEQDGVPTELDSRTSDAIAIGVRFKAPIYTLNSILDEVSGISPSSLSEHYDFDDENDIFGQDEKAPNEWDIYATEELEHQLSEALDNEDYELASKIRDELNRRHQN
ncbi:MAG: bifunctional nuclease family protein [Crocinitomicaceae bacterium]|jgi:bifunctional DNase/RNase|nr:bifunctional nuclease family protein [Crocinitomicaceae bacterium]MDP4722923.1 bifunctional nuclease family protein [Crocinitomicaceae bacterium]MDP4739588.1 bifunctional nuclease family protein [Crocinitomicaceae bacterium]MDP4799288.1 bifunctional nuclease family protein [Crocinitomicaceae bacterium]MDP4806849.1 bifunctional nuclease family protein [Crocinitomicaceae bacterium]